MAEAAVEERPPNPRFFCHKCSVEFDHASPEYTCPHCLGGFIEELEASTEGSDEVTDVEDDDDQYSWRNDMNAFLLELEERRASRPRLSHDLSSRRRRAMGTRIQGVRQPTAFHNLIQDFILNLGVGWGGPNQVSGNMLFLGNPGDYAWGREGLDAIVTQLLNQMDGTGPPPLSKEVIDTIPTVAITQEQVDAKVQCSVCWEDFVINESVRKLPCQHVYHENCICPWLELHGTCPICRQNLSPGGENAQNQDRNNSNSTGRSRSPRNRNRSRHEDFNLIFHDRETSHRNRSHRGRSSLTRGRLDQTSRGRARSFPASLSFDTTNERVGAERSDHPRDRRRSNSVAQHRADRSTDNRSRRNSVDQGLDNNSVRSNQNNDYIDLFNSLGQAFNAGVSNRNDVDSSRDSRDRSSRNSVPVGEIFNNTERANTPRYDPNHTIHRMLNDWASPNTSNNLQGEPRVEMVDDWLNLLQNLFG